MNIKKALNYIVNHAAPKEKPIVEEIVNELFEHLNKLDNEMYEMHQALKPFAQYDLCLILGGNAEGDESIVFKRNYAVLKIKHFKKAKEIINKVK